MHCGSWAARNCCQQITKLYVLFLFLQRTQNGVDKNKALLCISLLSSHSHKSLPMVCNVEVYRQVFGSIVPDRSVYRIWCTKTKSTAALFRSVNNEIIHVVLWMQPVFVMLCSFQKLEEGFARWLKWSNAKWRSAECVRNSIRAPCRCSRRGMRPQVAGKS